MPLRQQIKVRAICDDCGAEEVAINEVTESDAGMGKARDWLREDGWLIRYRRLSFIDTVRCPDCNDTHTDS